MPYWRLSACYFVYFAVIGALAPYLPLYLRALGYSEFWVAVMFAIHMLMKIVGPTAWGYLTDYQQSVMPLARWANLISALSFGLLPLAKGDFAIATLIAVFSFFLHAFLSSLEVVTLAHLGHENRRYTLVRVWGSVGFVVAAMGYGLMLQSLPILDFPWLLTPVFVLLWWISLLIPEGRVDHQQAISGSFHSQLKQPLVVGFFAILFLLHLSHGPYYAMYSLHLDALGYSSKSVGILWSLGVLAEVLVFLIMPKLLSNFGARPLMLWAIALAALRWLITATLADQPLWAGLAQLQHAASFGIAHAVAILYVAAFFPGAMQGRGQGFYSAITFGAGGTLGSLLAGWVWTFGGGQGVYLVASIIALLALLLAWYRLPTWQAIKSSYSIGIAADEK